jgi:hypothetical protein
LVLQIKETICYGMVFIFIISTEFFCWFVDLVRRGEDENKTTDPNHMFRLPTELENTNGMRFYYIPSKITITLMYNWILFYCPIFFKLQNFRRTAAGLGQVRPGLNNWNRTPKCTFWGIWETNKGKKNLGQDTLD